MSRLPAHSGLRGRRRRVFTVGPHGRGTNWECERRTKGESMSELDAGMRRLPVYLVLDCSGSMTGEPMEAVRQGMKTLLGELKSDPQALETVYLSVITFDS